MGKPSNHTRASSLFKFICGISFALAFSMMTGHASNKQFDPAFGVNFVSPSDVRVVNPLAPPSELMSSQSYKVVGVVGEGDIEAGSGSPRWVVGQHFVPASGIEYDGPGGSVLLLHLCKCADGLEYLSKATLTGVGFCIPPVCLGLAVWISIENKHRHLSDGEFFGLTMFYIVSIAGCVFEYAYLREQYDVCRAKYDPRINNNV